MSTASELELAVLQTNRRKVLSIIENGTHTVELREKSWELTSTICDHLRKERTASDPDAVDLCSQVLVHLSSLANPKEQLLSLLEQLQPPEDDDLVYETLLEPICKVLCGITQKFSLSVALALETIYSYVKQLPACPATVTVQDKQQLLMDADPAAVRTLNAVERFGFFLDGLLSGISQQQSSETKFQQLVMDYILMLLWNPLSHLDLLNTSGDNLDYIKSQARVTAEKLVLMFLSLTKNWCQELDRKRDQTVTEEDIDPQDLRRGFVVLMYVLYSDVSLLGSECPQVLSPWFKLQLVLEPLSTVLQSVRSLQQHYGLFLLQQLLRFIPGHSLTARVFELESISNLLQELFKIMCSAQTKEVALLSSGGLRCLYETLEDSGKHLLVRLVFHKCSNSVLKGFTITLIKDDLDKQLFSTDALPSHFRGRKLRQLLQLCLSLSKGSETDLVEEREHVLSALNLLRYMAVRDVANRTGVQDDGETWRNILLTPLRDGINWSRAHYQQELKEPQNVPGEMQVEGEILHMDKDQRQEALSVALCGIDLIESVLGRVDELWDS